MRVSYEWLKEYIDLTISPSELAEKMTFAGIAVETVEDLAEQYRGIIVAQVTELNRHPGADNLLIVELDAGGPGRKQVITAAKNLAVGDLVPLALPGTTLPNGKAIEEVTFKGVISAGMLCSGAELGLEKESAGIWVFSGKHRPGIPAAAALGATDSILVLELTANRPDCLGMIGVAREVAAILGQEFKFSEQTVKEAGPTIAGQLEIEISDPDLCPRYTGRVIHNVKIGPSPEWMQRRLRAAGIRPISNIVDITNYVMMEYNQPLHAFDYDRIANHRIIVRRAAAGEVLRTLDDVERSLQAENLLITDPTGPLCVAGVMGGASSEVRDDTSSILLEAAYFRPGSIRKTAKQLGMKSESSLRFERGIDPSGTVKAINRAAHLIEELGAGTVAKGYLDQCPKPIPPLTVSTSASAINRWLGTDLTMPEIKTYLERVAVSVQVLNDDDFQATIPTHRQDITHLADLAEEVARLYGYDRIPATLPPSRESGGRNGLQAMEFDCRKLLQGIGLSEILTYSLYAKDTGKRLGLAEADPLNQAVGLMVPLSEEQAVMRTNLIHSMLETLAFNQKRRQPDLAFYELARVYLPQPGSVLPEEPLHLAIGITGLRRDSGWNQERTEVDFYDLKGILEVLLEKFRIPGGTLKRSTKPFLHPGQSADIFIDGKEVGLLGQIHPSVAEEYGLTKRVFIMELDLTALFPLRRADVLFEALPKFPALERDLALVLSAEIPAREVAAKIETITGHLVETVELFDVYQGEQVPAGQRSLAFKLIYRSKERTLTDQEVNQLQTELLAKLHAEYGATVRA
jgi:phenylalanyl-tRNA synthetase beta chain